MSTIQQRIDSTRRIVGLALAQAAVRRAEADLAEAEAAADGVHHRDEKAKDEARVAIGKARAAVHQARDRLAREEAK